MLFQQDIKISANTTEADPSITFMKISKGIISRYFIVFPAGCAGLVHFRAFDGAHQFVPSTENQDLSADGHVFDLPDFYEMKEEPLRIKIVAWNEDEVYDHTISVGFIVLPDYAVLPAGAATGLINSLRSLFQRGR